MTTNLALKNNNGTIVQTQWEFSPQESHLIGIGYQTDQAAGKTMKAEELANIMINSLPGIFYLQDESGTYLKWNKNFETVSGYTETEIPSLNPLNFFEQKEHELITTAIAKAFTKGNAEVEATIITKDKRAIPYFFNGRAIKYDGKNCLIGAGIDMTKQMKVQQEILESEKKYHSLFEQASDPIMITDFKGNFIDINSNMCKMFGYSKKELLKMNIEALIDKEELKTVPIRFDLLAEGQHIFSNRKMLHRNGHNIYVQANVKKFGENLVMAIARDITELKKVESNLVTQEKQLRLFIEQSPAAIAMFDKEMRYLNISRRWMNDYKVTEEQLIGNIHYEIFPWIPQHWRDVHMRCLAGSTEKSDEDHYTNEDGTIDWLRWEVHPWYNLTGEIGGIIMLTEIITEKKNIEQALKEATEQKLQEQKRISRAIIKAQEKERNRIGQELHDNVNQILAGTKLYLKLAAKNNKAVEELIKYPMELIDSSIHEIRKLSSRQATPLKNIRLKDLVEILLVELEKNTRLKAVLKYDTGSRTIDDDLKLNIYRIIQEQVNNITKYAKAENVNILILANNNKINIEVKDDGVGFNVNKKRKGIGISNIINRAEAFNGEVLIESSPHNGTRIMITIPLAAEV
ncbi:MAG: PAS domain S-box protein [Ferruginibacter sp.]